MFLRTITFVLLCLTACTHGVVRREHDWQVPDAHYSVAALPDGPLTLSRWDLSTIHRSGDPDFLFRVWPPAAKFMAVHGIELRDGEAEKTLSDLVESRYGELSYVGIRLSRRDFGPEVTVSLGEGGLHPFDVKSGEAVEFSRTVDEFQYQFYFAFIRSPDRKRAVVVFYGTDVRFYALGLQEARSLARRIQFDRTD